MTHLQEVIKEHEVLRFNKFGHTVKVYHQTWCDQWSISITPFLCVEGGARRIVNRKMVAHMLFKY